MNNMGLVIACEVMAYMLSSSTYVKIHFKPSLSIPFYSKCNQLQLYHFKKYLQSIREYNSDPFLPSGHQTYVPIVSLTKC